METFTPSRLTLARQRRGYTKTGLAEEVGVSTRTIIRYENGEQEPDSEIVRRLCDALGFPAEFFSRTDREELAVGAATFRALSRLTARQRHRALAAGELALELARWIDERFHLPAPDIPKLDDVDPETAADVVRTEWGLGERPIVNMVHLLESRGIRVFSLVEDTADVDAFTCTRDGVPFVFLNTMKSAERSRLDAAHELAHLCLHRRHTTVGSRQAERDAQRFAAAFLMPKGSMLASAPRSARIEHLIRAKKRWKVSLTSYVVRMHELGLLSEWQYRTTFIELGKRGYRSNEPDPIPGETSQLLNKVFSMLRDQGLSKSDVATALNVPVEELNKMIFGLVLTVAGTTHVTPSATSAQPWIPPSESLPPTRPTLAP